MLYITPQQRIRKGDYRKTCAHYVSEVTMFIMDKQFEKCQKMPYNSHTFDLSEEFSS